MGLVFAARQHPARLLVEDPIFRLARVAGNKAKSVNFVKDHPGPGSQSTGPMAGDAQCRSESHLLLGDRVIVFKACNDFACS